MVGSGCFGSGSAWRGWGRKRPRRLWVALRMGRWGPKPPPVGSAQLVAVDATELRRLAYYKTEWGLGVLAPRGWYCYGMYGSIGASVVVISKPIPLRKFFGSLLTPRFGPKRLQERRLGGRTPCPVRGEMARPGSRWFDKPATPRSG